ncbi:8-oxo-dGTP pyrophosphatase MutT (NUDIX family) [Bacillus mesophilus]|uniref:CoA pyrophosphatase n=1 Tax=Bacillus mesophilus TaxID=1808955 RepID=A0A6M0QD45_9BACI|nr:CoA pyrophosphatase [Bacillus mesophilus]MBM7663507.1 8-oxo-dGTP pyrophosphatase MutT (NUDIX family) [Bacillus mesophilus]NEY74226.1 CoA pyrophosphatase [Bacillus mesophilus]
MDSQTIKNKVNGHIPSVLGHEKLSKYAVLLPLIEIEEEVHVLFEIRSEQLRRQPGDICFPGGRIDYSDQTNMAAALRETREELGIHEEDIQEVFPLDYLISPFGMMIFSFVGFIQSLDSIKLNPAEVGEIFVVPLSFFLENEPEVYHVNFKVQPDESFPVNLIAGGENYDWKIRKQEEHFYNYENKVIWGLTAKILLHFVELLKKGTN